MRLSALFVWCKHSEAARSKSGASCEVRLVTQLVKLIDTTITIATVPTTLAMSVLDRPVFSAISVRVWLFV